MNPLDFLERHFSQLPKSARVGVYLLVLTAYLYLLLAPRFINGQIVAKTKSGGIIPYRGTEMQVRQEGRTLKYQSNEDGYWSIPIVSRFPELVRIQVYNQDESAWFETKIEAVDVWKKIWNNEFRITVLSAPPGLHIERIARAEDSVVVGTSPTFDLVSKASAGVLVLPQTVKAPATPVVKPMADTKPSPSPTSATIDGSKNNIDQLITQRYAQMTGKNTTPNNLATASFTELSYVERIQLVTAIEKGVNIKIPDQHWKSFRTLAEISDYVFKRKVLESSDPKRYRINQAYDWADIEANSPPAERPQFRPAPVEKSPVSSVPK